MTYTAGVDLGSTYTKAVVVDEDLNVVGRAMRPTGFRLDQIGAETLDAAAREGGLESDDLSYVCLLYTSPSPRDATLSRMPSSA